MTTEVAEPQVEPPRGGNVYSRIAGVLFAPAETFEDIVRRPGVIGPLLVFLAIGIVSALLMAPRIDFESVKAAQAVQLKKRNVSDSDIARYQNVAVAGAKVAIWFSPLLGIVVYVIVAAIMWLAFRLMGGEGDFLQALSVTLYAWVPLAIYSLILAIVVVAHGSFDPVTAATLVKSNPAFLVDQKAQPVLFALASSFDVFTLWSLVLFTIGFATLSRLSRAMSAGIVITLWIVVVLLKMGQAALTA